MSFSRRKLLRLAGTGLSAPFVLPSRVWAQPPSNRLAHAAIGINGQGDSDIQALTQDSRVQVVAIADVDGRNHVAAKAKFPDARIYQDWRELFAESADRIDSVNIAVPDHMHAIIALSALKHRKHVYCQKPLTHTVSEARELREAAAAAGVVTRMGNQIQSSSEYRTAARMIQDGVIGKIREVRCWCSASFPQRGRPADSSPPPDGLAWDQWLGVAPERPWHEEIYHPFNWRGWQDFGSGPIGDFGCHIMDTPFRALGLTAPLSIRAEVPEEWASREDWRREVWPDWEIIHYEFPGTALTTGKTLPLLWTDGGKQPPVDGIGLDSGTPLPPNGCVFLGENGSLLLTHYGGRPILYPLSRDREVRPPRVPGSPQEHYSGFVRACLGEEKRIDGGFDYAGPLTEATLLGAIAVRHPQTTLTWDPSTMAIADNSSASAMVRHRWRKGWEAV